MQEYEGFDLIEHEWSHFVNSEKIDTKPQLVEISAPDDSLPLLCKRLNLHSIEHLKADIKLQRNDVNKIIHVNGNLSADILQKCVVTTDNIPEKVETEFEAWFSEPNQAVSFTKAKRERMSLKEQNEQPIIDECDDPEDVVNGKIDLGELVVQYLSLALNPYPRKEGVGFEEIEKPLGDAQGDIYDNPFAALKKWKQKEDKK